MILLLLALSHSNTLLHPLVFQDHLRELLILLQTLNTVKNKIDFKINLTKLAATQLPFELSYNDDSLLSCSGSLTSELILFTYVFLLDYFKLLVLTTVLFSPSVFLATLSFLFPILPSSYLLLSTDSLLAYPAAMSFSFESLFYYLFHTTKNINKFL